MMDMAVVQIVVFNTTLACVIVLVYNSKNHVIEGSLATLLTCPKIPQFVKKNQFMKTNWFVYIFASLEASLIFPLLT